MLKLSTRVPCDLIILQVVGMGVVDAGWGCTTMLILIVSVMDGWMDGWEDSALFLVLVLDQRLDFQISDRLP